LHLPSGAAVVDEAAVAAAAEREALAGVAVNSAATSVAPKGADFEPAESR
jgi:hypothetical protein